MSNRCSSFPRRSCFRLCEFRRSLGFSERLLNRRDAIHSARQSRNRGREAFGVRSASCRFGAPQGLESGSKLTALQTLRDARALGSSSQPANNLDCCSAENRLCFCA